MRFPRPKRNPIGGFGKAESGAAAPEFALVLFPFFLLMFGSVELGMVFLASADLQHATDVAARRIRTGEFQAQFTSADQFKTSVCNNMTWLKSSCAANLAVDVQTFSNFGGIRNSAGLDPADFDPSSAQTCWSAGEAGDIVLVRTYFKWQIITPLLDQSLVNTGDGHRMITSAASFRNEPWSTQAPLGAGC